MSKINDLHDFFPKVFQTKENPNWKALLEAIGQADDDTVSLTLDVMKQLFVKTANRPYLDSLGANVNIERPKLMGMEDTDLRKYIPLMSYHPKQVKLFFDKLLDMFFAKELTTSSITSQKYEPFVMEDEWCLSYLIDGVDEELILFNSGDFSV